jgi:hypothetical protein
MARRMADTCVGGIVAIVVIVIPGRGGGGDYSRKQSVPGCRPPGLSTRNPGIPDWGRRSVGPRLGTFDSQRNATMFRPTERQQRHTRKRPGRDYDSFRNHLHGFSPSVHAAFEQCARYQPTGRHARESIAYRSRTRRNKQIGATWRSRPRRVQPRNHCFAIGQLARRVSFDKSGVKAARPAR